MSIECPYCHHVIKLKGVKAGRYTPKCPNCSRAFALAVTGEGDGLTFDARPLPDKAAAGGGPAPPAPPPRAPAAPKHPAEAPPAGAKVVGARRAEAPPAPPPKGPPAAVPPPGKAEESAAEQATTFVQSDASAAAPQTVPGPSGEEDANFEVDQREPDATGTTPSRLGGYEVVQRLGRGGMGTVYLARQVSLDRPVALKVMNPRWAGDAVFLARFTREAYAAAQLVHHNIVQIYDIGRDRDTPFFSMEFVKGQTLSALVRERGKLDVEEAVGYVLQAARGLQFAHDQGMVHRDVKPDNLMLNEHGVVKVADLGLVKTPGMADPEPGPARPPSSPSLPEATDPVRPLTLPSPPSVGGEGRVRGPDRPGSQGALASLPSVTQVGTAVGTPAYMAPEQGRNASGVDHRADVYSLGCTLYVLLTGRAPFKGKTAIEVLVKHLTEQPVPPEEIAKRVPREISAVVMKMMAKKPEDRYANLGEVIRELEQFLGVRRAGPFSPTEEQADALEDSVKRYNGAKSARLRGRVWPAFFGACAVLTLLSGLLSLRVALGVVALAALTLLCSFVVSGVTAKTYLFARTRQLLLGAGWDDWVTWGAGAVLLVLLLYLTGMLGVWLGMCFLAAGLAATYHFLVERPLAAQRRGPVESAQKLLKGLRLRGVPEESVRRFVCKYGGDRWEEFFEELFGYELLLQARAERAGERRGVSPPVTPHRHAAWRDPLVRWIDAREKARKEAREKRLLQELERKKLQAEGVDAAQALARAEQAAEAMVRQAAELKQQASRQAALSEAVTAVRDPTSAVSARSLVEAAESPRAASAARKPSAGKGAAAFLRLVFGPKVRFLAGAALLVLFGLWVDQNDILPRGDVDLPSLAERLNGAEPLKAVPAPLSGLGAGLAGLLLLSTAFTRSGKLLFFLVAATLAALAGPVAGFPDVGPVRGPYVGLLLALAVAEFGIVFHNATRPQE